jgi:hypothetical protein
VEAQETILLFQAKWAARVVELSGKMALLPLAEQHLNLKRMVKGQHNPQAEQQE